MRLECPLQYKVVSRQRTEINIWEIENDNSRSSGRYVLECNFELLLGEIMALNSECPKGRIMPAACVLSSSFINTLNRTMYIDIPEMFRSLPRSLSDSDYICM
jgi:hypothetical protein